MEFLGGLAEAAERGRNGLLLIPLGDGGPGAHGAEETVGQAAVDGFCVHCVPDWHPALPALTTRGLPVVVSDLRPEAGTAMGVGIEEAAAAREIARHLVALGHRRIAVLGIGECPPAPVVVAGHWRDVRHWVGRERLRGYAEGLGERGVGWDDVTVVHVPGVSRESGAVAAALVLDRVPRPTAIVAMADVLALGVLDALDVRGLRPGADISVAGFDDIPEAAAAGLTTVRQPSRDKGRRAGELLLDPPDDPSARRVVLPFALVVRASTGPAPTGRETAYPASTRRS
ncbi:MAG: hypothetical protein QG622_3685 [Actinomycetota bacterium]|nr:hypothetical protein [Actinomycetota bacterium]